MVWLCVEMIRRAGWMGADGGLLFWELIDGTDHEGISTKKIHYDTESAILDRVCSSHTCAKL